MRKDTKNLEELAVCLKFIGDIYNEQNKFEPALTYYKRSIDILENTSDIDMFANNYNKLSNIQFDK